MCWLAAFGKVCVPRAVSSVVGSERAAAGPSAAALIAAGGPSCLPGLMAIEHPGDGPRGRLIFKGPPRLGRALARLAVVAYAPQHMRRDPRIWRAAAFGKVWGSIRCSGPRELAIHEG